MTVKPTYVQGHACLLTLSPGHIIQQDFTDAPKKSKTCVAILFLVIWRGKSECFALRCAPGISNLWAFSFAETPSCLCLWDSCIRGFSSMGKMLSICHILRPCSTTYCTVLLPSAGKPVFSNVALRGWGKIILSDKIMNWRL